MASNKVILLACGSFNPPTNMHLRMFEIAKDSLNRRGCYSVIGGVISPVHDAYGKKELVPSTYRLEMLKLALKSSNWIQISEWECTQESWSRTRKVLQHHQNLLNSVLSDQSVCPNNNSSVDVKNGYNYENWITNDIIKTKGPVQIKLLCGADLLESFATPGLWAEEDIETIVGQHGLVVITREGFDPRRFIYESDMLTKYQDNIIIVTEWITNDVSSTKVRRALRREESVKYLLEDSVIEFIQRNGLYGTKKNIIKYETTLNQNLSVPINTYILTPSPSDVISASSSGNDIFLNLNPISDEEGLIEQDANKNSNFETFQPESPENIASNSKCAGNQNKNFPYSKNIIRVYSENLQNPRDLNKVCFAKANEKIHFESYVQDLKELKPQKNCDSLTNKIEDQTQSSLPYAKFDEKKMSNIESDKNETIEKENLLLRRSQSDAVMSRKREKADAVSVKIQFTKDGIKVISDKESIV